MPSPNELRVSLELLPLDLLKQVLSHLQICDFTHLLDKAERSFLQQNPKLKYSIEQVIKHDSEIRLNHTSAASILNDLFFLEDRSVANKASIKTSTQLLDIHNYCIDESIAATFSITYNFFKLIDVLDFQRLFERLQPAQGIKYAIQIVFKDQFCYKVNMDHLQNLLAKVKDHVYLFAIEVEENSAEISGGVNTEFFKNLEILRLNNFSAIGFFSNCTKLRELVYVPKSAKEVFDIGQLPQSLKRLQLGYFSDLLWPEKIDHWAECPSLESIVLRFAPCRQQQKLPTSFAKVLKYMTCRDTKAVEFEGNEQDDGYGKEFWKLLRAASREKHFALDSLTVQLIISSPIETYPLTDLDIVAIKNPQVLSSFKSPDTLKSLRIAWVVECDTSDLFKSLPLGLKRLNLRGSNIYWSNSDLNFAKFVNLKELVLSRTKLGKTFNFCLFPDSIELLKLDDNGIGSVDKFTFPKHLKFLSISTNGISRLCNPGFPSTLKELNVSNNKLEQIDISKNSVGETLQIDVLYFEGNKCEVKDLSCSKLPQNLRGLSFEDYKQCHSNYSFGNRLEYLRMTETNLCQLKQMSFGNFATLKFLNLSECNLSNFNVDVPETVVEIDVSANKISEFPPQLCKLKNLRMLDMSFNEIGKLKVEFQYSTIEALNLSNNGISEVEMSFPKTVTNLKHLDLSSNMLKKLSMKSIGQTEKTLHGNLYELALSCNGKMKNDKVAALIKELPQSCECFWLDTYKDSENTEIDVYNYYVSNEIPGKLVNNKDTSKCRRIFGNTLVMGFSPEKNDPSLIKRALIFTVGQT
ncbi:hypothetical protein CANMA_005174 [Candida margitis]|uniref:uncharacterized protein n=1 Tax=Candida margitis TaxID=1775924 RepID=UPI0022260E4D|nr:uncharacterized protein CANMA_005174 [Candida margitis]KAI5950514.1 hypothetical protein CANMA_005174 [Candida margitis]